MSDVQGTVVDVQTGYGVIFSVSFTEIGKQTATKERSLFYTCSAANTNTHLQIDSRLDGWLGICEQDPSLTVLLSRVFVTSHHVRRRVWLADITGDNMEVFQQCSPARRIDNRAELYVLLLRQRFLRLLFHLLHRLQMRHQ